MSKLIFLSNRTQAQIFIILAFLLDYLSGQFRKLPTTTRYPYMVKKCMPLDKTLRAYHKACFLRPDTGPCRADILQWYYDVRQRECYKFFWGGCQGNGNRFETAQECKDYCYLNTSHPPSKVPFYCNLAFDYGTCFSEYHRWTFDKLTQTCRLRLYSGCGGNQNNFESREACTKTCIQTPDSTFSNFHKVNICIPFNLDEFNK